MSPLERRQYSAEATEARQRSFAHAAAFRKNLEKVCDYFESIGAMKPGERDQVYRLNCDSLYAADTFAAIARSL